MRPASFRKCLSGCLPPRFGALGDPAALHLGHLCQHSQDQFAHAAPDRAKAVNVLWEQDVAGSNPVSLTTLYFVIFFKSV